MFEAPLSHPTKPQVGTGWVVVGRVGEVKDIEVEKVVDISDEIVDGGVLLLDSTTVEDGDG